MSKTRKLLSVVIALVMVLSVFAVTASAYGYEAEDAEYTQTWALSEPVDNGNGTWTVDVSLTTNYPTGVIQFVVSNTDSSVAALTNVTLGSAIPAAYGASISKNLSSGKVMILVDTSDDETITASAINGVIATLTYTYSGSGSADIAIVNDPKTEDNTNGSLMAARMDNGDIVQGDYVVGQTVVSTGETRTIGSATVSPELVLTNGVTVNTGYCNTEYTGVIFGFSSFGSEANYRKSVTSTLGDEYIVYEANSDGKNGTGAVIKLVDLDKTTVLESYVVVVFGDVNGDGRVTTTDTTYLAKNRTTLASSTGADKLAANTNGDARHAVTTADTTYLAKNRTTMSSLQTTLAATY